MNKLDLTKCILCHRGFWSYPFSQVFDFETGKPRWAHKPCLAFHTSGHIFGICECKGYKPTLENAILLWNKIREYK